MLTNSSKKSTIALSTLNKIAVYMYCMTNSHWSTTELHCAGDSCEQSHCTTVFVGSVFFKNSSNEVVNYSTLHPLSRCNQIGDKFGDPTMVTG